jgi:hypothetical protein
VAGRCKHCKEDLSALRAGRPQAAAPLPSLAVAAPAIGHAEAVAAPAAIPVTIPTAREGSQPILPQRPTSQWRMKAQRPGGLAKHWPLIVIVLAVLAIVAAVVIMVLPEDHATAGKRRLSAPPAPDRMNTDPLGRQSQIDPWGDPNLVPDPQPDPNAHVTPDPPRQPPQPDPDDLFGGLGGGGGGGILGAPGGPGTGTFLFTMMHQACKKLQSCPSSDQSMLSVACSAYNSMARPPMPANCPSAQRCLDAIDAIECDAGIDDPLSAIALIQACKEAATQC